jgi:hypothetical protein
MSYYREERKGSFVLELLLKLLLIVAFVCLLIWIFPTKKALDPLFQDVFRNNVHTMRDAADSYFTNERMPKNVGDKVKLTLDEMLDMHLILPFVDKYGKECDRYNSYVEVTRLETEFEMKVKLVCSKEDAYIIVKIGCDDPCLLLGNCSEKPWENSGKTKEITQYEFKKTTKVSKLTGYKCDSGWTLQGTKCYRQVKKYLREPAEPIYKGTGDYKDPACRDDIKYTCPDSSWTSDGKGKCTKPASSEQVTGYVCDTANGWTKYDTTQCQKNASSSTTYDCGSGWSHQGGGNCTKSADTRYNCDGTIQSSSTCTKTVSGSTSYSDWIYKGARSYTYYVQPYTNTTARLVYEGSQWKYDCSGCSTGYYQYNYSYYEKTSSTTYSCGSGWSHQGGGTCTKSGTTVYVCDGKTQSSSTCTKTVTGKTNYSCSIGTVNESICLIPATYENTTQYTCPTGGTPVGQICQRDATKTTNKICDVCDSGYIFDSIKGKCYKEGDAEIIGYKCKSSDYVLDLDKKLCTKTIYANEEKKATGIYKQVEQTIYKWANTSTLSGWTATGRTRTIKVTCTTVCK